MTSKSQRAYEHVRGAIDAGAISPGERLVLQSIADEVGVSVVPVREAIRRLEAEGLVTFERNVGARVATIDPALYADTTEALAVVEGAAVASALPGLDAVAVADARAINARLRASLADFDPVAFTRLNEAFHRALTDPCENTQLAGFVDAAWRTLSQIRRSTFAFVPERARDSVDEHDALLDLIASGASPREVEDAVRAHRLVSLHAYIDRSPASARTDERPASGDHRTDEHEGVRA